MRNHTLNFDSILFLAVFAMHRYFRAVFWWAKFRTQAANPPATEAGHLKFLPATFVVLVGPNLLCRRHVSEQK